MKTIALTLLLTAAFIGSAHVQAQCSVTVSGVTYDLNPINDIAQVPGNADVRIRICADIVAPNGCPSFVGTSSPFQSTACVCQRPNNAASANLLLMSTTSTSFGPAPTWSFLNGDKANGLTYSANNGDNVGCGAARATTINFVCDASAGYGTLTTVYDMSCVYIFQWTTAYVCPSKATSSDSDDGLSGGSIFLIIFFVFLAVYCIAGALVMKFVYKVEGVVTLIPNYEFWFALPGLCLDGCKFTYAKFRAMISGNASTGATYDTMS